MTLKKLRAEIAALDLKRVDVLAVEHPLAVSESGCKKLAAQLRKVTPWWWRLKGGRCVVLTEGAKLAAVSLWREAASDQARLSELEDNVKSALQEMRYLENTIRKTLDSALTKLIEVSGPKGERTNNR